MAHPFLKEIIESPYIEVEFGGDHYWVFYNPVPMDEHDYPWEYMINYVAFLPIGCKLDVESAWLVSGNWLRDANGILFGYLSEKISESKPQGV